MAGRGGAGWESRGLTRKKPQGNGRPWRCGVPEQGERRGGDGVTWECVRGAPCPCGGVERRHFWAKKRTTPPALTLRWAWAASVGRGGVWGRQGARPSLGEGVCAPGTAPVWHGLSGRPPSASGAAAVSAGRGAGSPRASAGRPGRGRQVPALRLEGSWAPRVVWGGGERGRGAADAEANALVLFLGRGQALRRSSGGWSKRWRYVPGGGCPRPAGRARYLVIGSRRVCVCVLGQALPQAPAGARGGGSRCLSDTDFGLVQPCISLCPFCINELERLLGPWYRREGPSPTAIPKLCKSGSRICSWMASKYFYYPAADVKT